MAEDQKIVQKRRRVPRREVNFSIGLLISGKYYITRACEIGEGGMLVEFEHHLEQGQRVVISYSLPGLFQEVVRGKVVYVSQGEPKKYGIQFHSVDFEIKRKIRNFVASATQIRKAS